MKFLLLNKHRRPFLRLYRAPVVLGFTLLISWLFSSPALAVTSMISNSSITAASQPATERHLVKTSEGTIHAFVQIGTQTATCGGISKSGLLWFNSTDGGTTWVCQDQLSSDTTNLMYASATVDASEHLRDLFGGYHRR